MLRSKHFQRYLATAFTVVYLLVALFSQNFHNHGSGEVFKDYQFKSSEKTWSTSHLISEYSDCLSCHLLHDGNSLLPEEFHLNVVTPINFRSEVFSYHQRFSELKIFNPQLRGPPNDFI